jgi:uncharacterized low-complexity protein
MKHFNQISKILLIVVAIIGLTIGMSSIYGFNSLPDDADATALADSSKKAVQDSKCGDGKCGGDEAKADVKDTKCGDGKCGDGKCGDGKCGGDKDKTAVSDKVNETKADVKDAKCGGDKDKTAVSDKVNETKADVKDAKCGAGKCG